MKYFTEKLMQDIKKGGIIFSLRRTGKTFAAIKILDKNPDFILSCPTEKQAKNLQNTFPHLKSRIYGSRIEEIVGKKEKLILDEFLYHPLVHTTEQIIALLVR